MKASLKKARKSNSHFNHNNYIFYIIVVLFARHSINMLTHTIGHIASLSITNEARDSGPTEMHRVQYIISN